MRLITNREEFYNDICEEIRLFVPRAAIRMDNDGEDDSTELELMLYEEDEFRTEAVFKCGENRFEYTHSTELKADSEIIKKRYSKRCMKAACFRVLRMAYPEKLIPWGSLTGIRPTRLLRELIDTEGDAEAARLMLE
ncbi:MAG: hypothetical protein IKX58_06020, partial [Clostridia bacterium]|nr:hypothetical protein [Clostridia bacterium]